MNQKSSFWNSIGKQNNQKKEEKLDFLGLRGNKSDSFNRNFSKIILSNKNDEI